MTKCRKSQAGGQGEEVILFTSYCNLKQNQLIFTREQVQFLFSLFCFLKAILSKQHGSKQTQTA